jgi:GDPmannose 4,6-dehydratase
MKIIITGISGQDGIFLTNIIKKKHSNFSKGNFDEISKLQDINILNIDLTDKHTVGNLIADVKPDIIFNLSGPSSVYDSLKNPKLENKITTIFNNLTNSLIENNNFCRFYQASTSEMFGLNNKLKVYDEKSKFLPNSPYASGKYSNHQKVKELRENYTWNIYSGIMFNHESEFRKKDYLFMKIIDTAQRIKNNEANLLTIGSLDYCRDWSYAEDIAEGILRLSTEGSDYDYVLGSGVGTKIEQIVKTVFDLFDLDYKNYVEIDNSILRLGDPEVIVSNPTKIQKELGWQTKHTLENFVEKIVKKVLT